DTHHGLLVLTEFTDEPRLKTAKMLSKLLEPGGTGSMATDTTMDVSVLERIGDGFTAFSEGCVSLLTRVFGSSNERLVRQLGLVRTKSLQEPYKIIPGSLLAQVNELEPQMQELTDEQLKELTPKYRERLAKGETLEDLLPEAFAACRE